jgi:hypothetical protein
MPQISLEVSDLKSPNWDLPLKWVYKPIPPIFPLESTKIICQIVHIKSIISPKNRDLLAYRHENVKKERFMAEILSMHDLID